MTKAIWNDTVIASSDRTVVVEGNHYFPMDDVDQQYLRTSATHTVCAWKGTASYFDVVVNGETNSDAAWTYPEPKPEAEQVTDRVAFWNGVRVED